MQHTVKQELCRVALVQFTQANFDTVQEELHSHDESNEQYHNNCMVSTSTCFIHRLDKCIVSNNIHGSSD